ncbi:Xenobiotic-transporting ATPase protein [Dioscorea alata]|uniref:Xenobiotic-transporting ATPase protein n=1 Tax=Dioscorea alata TaxID=55571 RepID=A0ACB7UI87_DIOAL|nr:Xenobiotic-transporting ATPase protein [Dioscorea alata]
MRVKYLKAILRQDVEYFDLKVSSTSDVITSVSSDSLIIQDVISEKVPTFIMRCTIFVGSYIVAFIIMWRLALVAFPTVLLLIIPGILYGRTLMNLARKIKEESDKTTCVIEQAISSIRTVYSFVGESKTMADYSVTLNSCVKLGLRQGLIKGLAIGSSGISFAIWAFVSWYGSKLIMYSGAHGGNIYAVGIEVTYGGLTLGSALSNLKYFSEALAAGERIMEVMDRVPKIDIDTMENEILQSVDGEVQFKGVNFAYPSRPENVILNEFSLKVPAGMTVALVGSSGSGKSTVIALLERFYDPLHGEVLLDGVNIKRLKLKWLRSQMGLVSQEPALFATSIKENILFGKEDASMDEVVAAAKASNAHNFISQLPQGYDTQVGERGVQMSGGQKQRIAIARALIKSPKILLLDEATSALDSESERIVQEALDNASLGRTTIVIAHRLSTIRNADLIVVVQAGQVMEIGSHIELMEKDDGLYSSLVHLQQSPNEDNKDKDGPSASSSMHSNKGNNKDRKSHTKNQSFSTEHELDFAKFASNNELIEKDDSLYSSLVYLQQSPKEANKDKDGPSASSSKHSNKGNTKDRKSHTINRSFSTEHELDFPKLVSNNKEPKDKSKTKLPAPSFSRLLLMSSPEWKQVLLGILSSIFSGGVQPLYSYLLGSVISTFFLKDHKEIKNKMKTYSLIFLGLSIFSLFINILQHYNIGAMGEYITKRLREKMLSKILTFDVSWFDRNENSTGAICSRLTNDANAVRSLVGDGMALLIQAFSTVVIACAVGLVIAWRLALVMIAVQPLVIMSCWARKMLLKNMSTKSIKAQAESSKLASEAVSNFRTVTAFSSQDHILHLFEKAQEDPLRESVKQSWYAGFGLGVARSLTIGIWALDFWYGGKLVSHGDITIKALLKTFFVLFRTGYVIADASSMTSDIAKCGDAVDSLIGNVDICDIDFAYPTRPDIVIFKNFSLSIQAQKSTALVGQSGSGKSTIIGLIERFYDPLRGTIEIDGRNIKAYHLRELRQHIALVGQEPTLFAGTIKENIKYGSEKATEAEVEAAARVANAHDFISCLKDGYRTWCGDRGVQLSGGQKQRIAIARAVLKNPTILLLDEATSALDSQSEKMVQEALERVMIGRTSVVVAHRLSTIQNCDLIAVLEKGMIVEKGNHGSLIAKGPSGSYFSLVNLQQSKS